jgi:hypothetical protein
LLGAPKLGAGIRNSEFGARLSTATKPTIRLKLSLIPHLTSPIPANQEFTAEVLIDNANNVYSCGFDLVFDQSRFEIVGVSEGDLLKQAGVSTALMQTVNPGRVIVGLSRLGEVSGVNGSGVLIVVTLKAIKESPVEFSLENVSVQDPDLNLISVKVQNLISISNTSLSPNLTVIAYPNPAKDKITFRLNLPKDAQVKIEVFNVAGERVIEFKEHKTAPTDTITWQPIDVASGVYIYLVTVEGEQVSGKVAVMR